MNEDTDDMVPTPNSYDMHERIKDSRLVIYPHAGHGSLFQLPEEFTAEVNDFLADADSES
ncbi:MAG: alpha/beta fold hydrolase [Pauljensenia sp.]